MIPSDIRPPSPGPPGRGWKTRVSTATGLSLGIIASLLVALLALGLFAWLANKVVADETWKLDVSLRSFAYLHSSPALTLVMRGISALGSPLTLLVLALFLVLWFRRSQRSRAAFWLAVVVGGAFALTYGLKQFFERPRPLPFHIRNPASYSFPSGHALVSLCFYFAAAALLSPRISNAKRKALLWLVAALLVTAIGASRIYLGVHYPSDVLAGYAAAAIWLVTLLSFARRHGRGPEA